jgi:peptidoglycan glycosyltransferase
VNVRISRLYRALALAFVALIGTCTYWQVWAAPSLEARQDNPRLVYRELAIKRGKIISADGVTLASNTGRRANGRTIYFRRYPRKGETAALVGYSSVQASRAGVERSRNDYLTGANTDLAGGVERLLDTVRGQTVTGNDVILSLDASAQRIAMRALRDSGKRGAVVALEPSTGRILVMASWPTYDPNLVDKDFASVLKQPGAPLLNRATQGLYPPGSTFKIVTAAAALESGTFDPSSEFSGGKCVKTQGPQLCNASGEIAPSPNTLADALVHSYNTTFAQVGQKLGQDRLVQQMQAFGFWSQIPIDYPREQMATSGIYRQAGKIGDPNQKVDVSRIAIGQAGLLTSPLQMAMVTSAIANGGVLMAPRAVDRIRSPSGRVVAAPGSDEIGRAVSAQTASTLSGIMQRVVDEGTGREAQIGNLPVAGKTGTAQTGRKDSAGRPLSDAWFVAFAPVSSPKVAIAVVIEDSTGFGGTVAAPVARAVLDDLI